MMGMTEKRFTYDSKTVSILKDGEFWLDGNIDTACNHSEICGELNALHEENEHYKALFFELVETALTDKNCRELYCKGILNIFDKANSLNQARDMIKEHLND